jgi:hypothetical protein
MCQGPAELLGTLATVTHMRCRCCGWTYQEETTMHPSITPERVIELAEASMMDGEFIGICKKCGEEQGGVEPDATGYCCESCESFTVSGAEALALEVL